MVAMPYKPNAIVITGRSGRKMLVGDSTLRRSANRDGSFDVVDGQPNDRTILPVCGGLLDTGPTLFYVEDPWGQYPRVAWKLWTEQLPRLLRDARPGHQYVVTSRSDQCLGQARASEDLKGGRWRWMPTTIGMANSPKSTINAWTSLPPISSRGRWSFERKCLKHSKHHWSWISFYRISRPGRKLGGGPRIFSACSRSLSSRCGRGRRR